MSWPKADTKSICLNTGKVSLTQTFTITYTSENYLLYEDMIRVTERHYSHKEHGRKTKLTEH